MQQIPGRVPGTPWNEVPDSQKLSSDDKLNK